jgi:hypothetical protein
MLKKNKQAPKRQEPLSSENHICRRTRQLQVVESFPTPDRENGDMRPVVVAQQWDNCITNTHPVNTHGLAVNLVACGFNTGEACNGDSDYCFESITCTDIMLPEYDSHQEINVPFTEKYNGGHFEFHAVEVDSEDEDDEDEDDYDEDDDDDDDDDDDYEDYDDDDDYDEDEDDDDYDEDESEIIEIEDYEYYNDDDDDDDDTGVEEDTGL